MGQAIFGQCCNIHPFMFGFLACTVSVSMENFLRCLSGLFIKTGLQNLSWLPFFSFKSMRLFWSGGNDCGVFSSPMLCKSRVYDLLLTDQSNIRYILRLMARQVISDLTSWAFAIFFQGDLCLYEIYLVMPVTTLAKY